MAYDRRTVEEMVADAISSAKKGHGHIPGRSDVTCLGLALTNCGKFIKELLATINARNQRISVLEQELRELRKENEG